MKSKFVFCCLIIFFSIGILKAQKLESPSKKLSIKVYLQNGKIFYDVFNAQEKILGPSALGIFTKSGGLTNGMKLIETSKVKLIKDDYQLLNGKRANNYYLANRQSWKFENNSPLQLEVIFQVSDDGFAFQYHISSKLLKSISITGEESSFRFPESAKAWLQPMSVAKTGWEHTNPSYEEFYQKEIPVGTPSTLGAGWVYPALFNNKNTWFAITETGLDTNYCASRLSHLSPNGNYKIAFPDEREVFTSRNAWPQTSLPTTTPWRVMAVGSLKTLVESTLGTDLAKPAMSINQSFIKPGAASWSWVMLKDNNTVYDVQKQFIDYASEMKWPYCLIDADWDRKIGYDKITELATYAKTKNVGLILWYNSAGDWNTVKYTPKDKIFKSEVRKLEFAKLQQMGIKGIKVDFFGGDGQSMIKYYFDIFADAAQYGLLVNCHGATMPRGWQRTWPNLMTMESIKGMEFITFEQKNADEEPAHATTIPFTRNLFDPMDFTPMSLYKIPKIERKTSAAFELATAVLFQSGIQHLAETPAGMDKMPIYVKQFLTDLPTTFSDTKFLDGYPGKFVVLARKVGQKWIVAGMNAQKATATVNLDLSFINAKMNHLITDGEGDQQLQLQNLKFVRKMKVPIKSNGGFVLTFD
jgi:alpha-glucosidase